MPHRKNASRETAAVVVRGAPVSARPKAAGPTKWADDVMESSTGRSLNRMPGAEYATTATRVTTRTTADAQDPHQSSASTNGTGSRQAHHSVSRCQREASTMPSTPPLRGLRRSDS